METESMEPHRASSSSNESRKSTSLRKDCYRKLLHVIEEIQESEDVGLQTVKEVNNVLKEANELDEEYNIKDRVDKVDETLIDTFVIASSSSILVKCIDAADVYDAVYEPTEFANKIHESINNDGNETIHKNDWLKLMDTANGIISQIPIYSFVFGAFDPTQLPVPKIKVQHKREQQEKLQKKCLENVPTVNKEQGIDETVNFLLKVLKQEFANNANQPINYYSFVVDADSFANTVENMFHCSFLMRNGTAAMDIDASGTPVIRPISKQQLDNFRKRGDANVQMTATISINEWQNLRIQEGFLQRHKKQSVL